METLDLRVRADQNAGHRKRRANYRAGDSPQYLAKASVAAGYAAAAAAKPWDPMGQAADPSAGALKPRSSSPATTCAAPPRPPQSHMRDNTARTREAEVDANGSKEETVCAGAPIVYTVLVPRRDRNRLQCRTARCDVPSCFIFWATLRAGLTFFFIQAINLSINQTCLMGKSKSSNHF
jgi:hypothetical protein